MRFDFGDVKIEIDLGNVDLAEQREAFKELLETVPDKDLRQVFELSASQELEDMLKTYFMEKYGLVEPEYTDEPETTAEEGP